MNTVKTLTPQEFRKMQLLQLDMLVELDRVCQKHNIKYVIFGGTLLGAVRHKGYIPWDDDADVAMLREEYERFKKVASELNPEICYFQDHTTDPYYRWGYGKLRRTGTTYVRVGQEHLKCKTGVFIDVFPMDDCPISTLGQMWQDFYCFCLRKILWSEVAKMDATLPWYKKVWFKFLSHISPKWVFGRTAKMAAKSNNTSSNRVRTLLFPATGTLYVRNSLKTRFSMPKKWFLETVPYSFENHPLQGSKDYEEELTYVYGDWRKLPPVEKRVVHAPVSAYDLGREKVKK